MSFPFSSGFVDAQEMHRKFPKSFDVPDDKELNDLKIGDMVKIANGKERFWVQITKHEKDKLEGTVENLLLENDKYDYGDILKFSTRNIYQIMKKETQKKSAKKPVKKSNTKKPVKKSNTKKPVKKSNTKKSVKKPVKKSK